LRFGTFSEKAETSKCGDAGELVAPRLERSDAISYTRYVHKDHLGSVLVATDETSSSPTRSDPRLGMPIRTSESARLQLSEIETADGVAHWRGHA